MLEECVRRGIAVSAAHTDATFEQIRASARRGLRQVTHMFNAMSPLGHREPGVVGAALLCPEIRCELIADNIHVHPEVMNLLYRVKGREGIILISDAVEAAGLPDGDYRVDGRDVMVKDGAVRLPDGTLAGSTLTMDRALRNLAKATGEHLESLWPTTSLNAARAIGIDDRKGRLAVGLDGDVAILDPDGTVWMTIAEGRIVYSRG
jgi:N-acetylglucosamine-6-phosphate deacetylase